MAFVLRKETVFTRKIKVRVPTNGGFREEEFRATFKMLDAEEARELHENGGDRKDQALLREVFSGFEGVKAENEDGSVGDDVPYSDEARDLLIGVPYVALPLVMAYFEAINGGRVKN